MVLVIGLLGVFGRKVIKIVRYEREVKRGIGKKWNNRGGGKGEGVRLPLIIQIKNNV